MGEVRFKRVADTRKVSSDGLRFDVVRHNNHKKTKGVRGRINGEMIELAEGKIRLEMQIVSVECK